MCDSLSEMFVLSFATFYLIFFAAFIYGILKPRLLPALRKLGWSGPSRGKGQQRRNRLGDKLAIVRSFVTKRQPTFFQSLVARGLTEWDLSVLGRAEVFRPAPYPVTASARHKGPAAREFRASASGK